MCADRVRVLFCIPNLHGGGAEKTVLTLAAALDPSAFDTTVFAHEKWGSLLQVVRKDLKVVYQNDGEYRRNQLPGLLARTMRLGANSDVIVGANEGRATFMAAVAAKTLRKPLVGWLHNNWVEFSKIVSWKQRLALKIYGRMAAVVCVSDGVGQAFRTLVAVPPARMHTIYNGMPRDAIVALSREPLDPEHQRIFERPTVLTVGRLDYQKGQDSLLAAHAILVGRGLGHQLVLVGDGPLRGALERQAAELNIADSVHFLGYQHNPYRFMSRSTVFTLCSRFEGFGIVLAEAMMCGTAVVSADCPSGPAEVLGGGRYGVLVAPGDPAALASGIEPALKDARERDRLAAAALARGTAFEIGPIAKQWQDLFVDLARRPGHSPALRKTASVP